MKNNSRRVDNSQAFDPKSLSTDSVVSKYAIAPSGKMTFIAGDGLAPANPVTRRRKRKATAPWKPGKVWSVCNLRINGIQRVISGRHGGPVDTDDGITYFEVALVHLVARRVAMKHEEHKIMSFEWAETWTPVLAALKGRDWFAEQEARILDAFEDVRPYIPSADAVADALQITAAEIERYAVKSIGAIDRREGVRIKEAQGKHAERETTRRVSSGSTPRSKSMARTKPWETFGMSRSTYYRAIERGDIQPDRRMKKGPGKATPTGTVLRLVSQG